MSTYRRGMPPRDLNGWYAAPALISTVARPARMNEPAMPNIFNLVSEQLPPLLREKTRITVASADPYMLKVKVNFWDHLGLKCILSDVQLLRAPLPDNNRVAAWRIPDAAMAYLCL